MKRRTFGLFSSLALGLLVAAFSADAQQPHKVPRVAYLSSNLAGIPHRIEAFRQGLRELGYMEGKNIVIEWRSAKGKRGRSRKGKLSRLRAPVAELVRL